MRKVETDTTGEFIFPQSGTGTTYLEKSANNKVLTWAFNGTFDFGRNTLNPFDTNYAFSNTMLGSVLSYSYDLPKLSGHWNNVVTRFAWDHWQITGITSFIGGAPLGLTYSLVSGADITGASGTGVDSRVDVTCNVTLPKGDRTFSQVFNTKCVAPPSSATFGIGNATKEVFRGSGINNFDISIVKNFRFTSTESRFVQFRFEMYNAFNHTQFSVIDTGARFDAAGNQVNSLFGSYTSARDTGRVQFGLKIRF